VLFILPILVLFGVYLYCALRDPKFEEMLRQNDIELKKKAEHLIEFNELQQPGDEDPLFYGPDPEELGLIAEEDSVYGIVNLEDEDSGEDGSSQDVSGSESFNGGISELDESMEEKLKTLTGMPSNLRKSGQF
jgi:hypothetical protein